MNYIYSLLELFAFLFGYAASSFTVIIGLFTVAGIIGGLATLFKKLLIDRRGKTNE